jgi:superfamily II DNA or RNA helicase
MKNYYQIIKERGLEEYSYQKNFLTNPKYDTDKKTVGLFMGTDAGKTTVASIKLAIFYSNPKNNNKLSVVFAAARKDTRTNIQDTFKDYKKYFNSQTIESVKELEQHINNKTTQVLVVLPQVVDALRKRKTTKLPKIDGWMIYDEAHEYYLKPMVQKIIKIMSPRYKMVMTGTPFIFNSKKDYESYYVSVEELQNLGKSGDADVITVASAYNFRKEDYLSTDDLRTNVKINENHTSKTLELVFKQMLTSLKCKFNSNFKLYQLTGYFNEINPTIIYARNREMGNQIIKVCNSLKLNAAYSDSVNDPDSKIISDFKEGKYKFLIVVDRIKQGFSYNELFNIVDMSLTTKPSVIMQMYGRLLRKSKLQPNKIKRYFKVVPKNEVGYVESLMLGVLNLCTTEFYSKFNNVKSTLPIPRIKGKKGIINPPRKNSNNQTININILQSFSDIGMNLNLQNFKSIKHNENKYFQITRIFKLKDIKWILLDHKRRGAYSDEEIMEESLKHTEWKTFTKTKEYQSAWGKYNGDVSKFIHPNMTKAMSWDRESIDIAFKLAGSPKESKDLHKHKDKTIRGAYHGMRSLGIVKEYFPDPTLEEITDFALNECKLCSTFNYSRLGQFASNHYPEEYKELKEILKKRTQEQKQNFKLTTK